MFAWLASLFRSRPHFTAFIVTDLGRYRLTLPLEGDDDLCARHAAVKKTQEVDGVLSAKGWVLLPPGAKLERMDDEFPALWRYETRTETKSETKP